MTEHMPTAQQFVDAIGHLQGARDACYVIGVLEAAQLRPTNMRVGVINDVRKAVEALGFQMVSRGTKPSLTVVPSGNDGGRMDIGTVADA